MMKKKDGTDLFGNIIIFTLTFLSLTTKSGDFASIFSEPNKEKENFNYISAYCSPLLAKLVEVSSCWHMLRTFVSESKDCLSTRKSGILFIRYFSLRKLNYPN